MALAQKLDYFNCLIFFIVVQLRLSAFSAPPTPCKPTSLPRLHPPPWFCPCVLYSSSWKPLSPLYPPHSLLAIVRLLLTSMSLAIFCLLFSFVDYVPVKGKRVEVGEGGGISLGGVEGWGENADNGNWIKIKKKKKWEGTSNTHVIKW